MPKTKELINPNDLARETGISQRMIAYYEKQPQYPPMHVMTILSEALGIPAQELLKSKNQPARSGMRACGAGWSRLRSWRRRRSARLSSFWTPLSRRTA